MNLTNRTFSGRLLTAWHLGLFIAMLPCSSAQAAEAFDEGFGGPTLNPSLEDPDNAYTIANDAVSLTSSTDHSDRHYIRTVSTDYNACDFVAEVTFTLTVFPRDNGSLIFFGLGSGARDSSRYNEPQDSVLFRIHTPDVVGGRVDAVSHTTGGNYLAGASIGSIVTSGGTHRARIMKTGNEASFSIDVDFNGTFSGDMSYHFYDLATVAPFLDDTSSRLFFGTASTVDSFDDFNVALTGADSDGDGIPDCCDACPLDADNDTDDDGICGDVDNCVFVSNPSQSDIDGDGDGDACDDDDDNDGWVDTADNCQYDFNPAQEDFDGDGVGDICDQDDDNDGVIDADDQCISTPEDQAVRADGCSVAEICSLREQLEESRGLCLLCRTYRRLLRGRRPDHRGGERRACLRSGEVRMWKQREGLDPLERGLLPPLLSFPVNARHGPRELPRP